MQRQTRYFIFILAGFIMLLGSVYIFPAPSIVSFGYVLSELIYHPFRLLIFVVLFILGFLTHSYVLRKIAGNVIVHKMKLSGVALLQAVLLLFSYLVLYVVHGWPAIVALGLFLLYGIMDIDFEKGKRNKKQ